MTTAAPVKTPAKTPAEEGLARAFGEAAIHLPGDAEIRRQRAAAFTAFDASGLPHRRIEDWKYTDLRALMADAKPLAPPPTAADIAAARDAGAAFAALGARRLVLLNGSFEPGLSDLQDLAELEPGLQVRPLAQALTLGDPMVRAKLGRLTNAGPALALNTAFLSDGVVIEVAPGAQLARPLLLVSRHGGPATANVTRNLVIVGAGASLTLIECFEGPPGVDYQTNAVLDLELGAGASLELVRHQAEGDRALHLHTLLATADAGAKLSTCFVTIGAAVSRQEVRLALPGADVEIGLRGTALLRGRQHADTTLLVEHKATGGVSREQFKTVLDGEAHGVFQGKIIVEAEAQQTDGRMSSNALVLSEGAAMDNKPELEIYADDVQCGHGATASALDPALLFYLRSRGVPKEEAEALLIQSFVADAYGSITHEALREHLAGAVEQWLGRRGTG